MFAFSEITEYIKWKKGVNQMKRYIKLCFASAALCFFCGCFGPVLNMGDRIIPIKNHNGIPVVSARNPMFKEIHYSTFGFDWNEMDGFLIPRNANNVNYAFWWSTLSKMNSFFAEKDIKTISFLYNTAFVVEDFIVCGSRGWYQDEDSVKAKHDCNYEKIIARECIRLQLSLDEGKKLKEQYPDKEIIAFMHFPPFWNRFECREFIDILKKYGVERCYFGHIHGNYVAPGYVSYEGIDFIIISADYLEFTPRLILPR